MRCPRCGRMNPRDAAECAACGTALHLGVGPAPSTPIPARGSPWPWTLGLAVVLALLGVGAAQAAGLLQHAMRIPTAGDLAAQVCTDLETQNYTALVSQIAPASGVTGAQSTLNPATVAATLESLDNSAGRVTACQSTQLSIVSNSSHGAVANFALTIHRAHASAAQGLVLILLQQPDGSWKIDRTSALTTGA